MRVAHKCSMSGPSCHVKMLSDRQQVMGWEVEEERRGSERGGRTCSTAEQEAKMSSEFQN